LFKVSALLTAICINYTKAFTFKQLACYVHYETLEVYKQHSPRILGVTQIPNQIYATAIATAYQVVLQDAIADATPSSLVDSR
jgi:hypothetical protein